MSQTPDAPKVDDSPVVVPKNSFLKSDDAIAMILGGIILLVTLGATAMNRAPDIDKKLATIQEVKAELKTLDESQDPEKAKAIKAKEEELTKVKGSLYTNPLKPYIVKIGEWKSNPSDAFVVKEKSIGLAVVGIFCGLLVLFSIGAIIRGESPLSFGFAFIFIFLLAVVSYVLASQETIKYYNLEYALWALLIGMVISNTIGTPKLLFPAIRTELFIKTGLILLGAEILLSRLLALGLPGILTSWVVTPITLITTFLFGQYILRIPSKSLNMVISADMSVCGVSAAIATAAACRAKKEELSLAIGISLFFTAVMMVVMPPFIRAVGMSDVLAGAWLGGTIDSTGAVAAAGGMLSSAALQVAVTVKMIQNILIGVVAFGVAIYWVSFVERNAAGPRPSLMEIWYRFPKFVLGFVAASLVFSWISSQGVEGSALVDAVITGTTKTMHGWLFCLAFVAIGLESNFREMYEYLSDGKAVVLYVCGQTLNLALSLFMAWLMFEVIFRNATMALR